MDVLKEWEGKTYIHYKYQIFPFRIKAKTKQEALNRLKVARVDHDGLTEVEPEPPKISLEPSCTVDGNKQRTMTGGLEVHHLNSKLRR